MASSDFVVKLNQLKQGISTYCATVLQKFTTIRNRLNAHTTATGNVHDLQASEIGLGNVPDWPPADQATAERGLSNNSFMTPRRTDDYVNKNVYEVIGDAFSAAADDL